MIIAFGHPIQFKKNSDTFTDDELYEFCVANKDLQIERDANQNILIMAPVGSGSGFYEKDFIFEVEFWVRKNKTGRTFSSSTGFILPNGAMRSPDACWVSEERWAKVTAEQKKKFPPVVPDFIVEIRSETDSLKGTKAKLEEWIENGVRLAWLIDTKNKEVYVYRENGSIEIIKGFDKKLTGEDVMVDFEFDLKQLKMP